MEEFKGEKIKALILTHLMEKSLELVHKGNEIEVPQTWYDYAAFL
jgi:hypothetical protein